MQARGREHFDGSPGAKLSKSLLREHGAGVLPTDVEPWMLDTTAWFGDVDNYVDALVWLVSELLTDPKHFFRHSPSRNSDAL